MFFFFFANHLLLMCLCLSIDGGKKSKLWMAKVTVIFYFSSNILLRLTPSGKKQMKQKTSTRCLLEGIWLATLETATVTSFFSLKNSVLSQKHLCAQLHVQVLSVCVAFSKTLKSSKVCRQLHQIRVKRQNFSCVRNFCCVFLFLRFETTIK